MYSHFCIKRLSGYTWKNKAMSENSFFNLFQESVMKGYHFVYVISKSTALRQESLVKQEF